jgi:methylmalonyl-CoA mutase
MTLNHSVLYTDLIAMESALIFLIWRGIRASGTSLRELIGGRWQSARDVLRDILIGVSLWIVLIVVASAWHALRGGGELPGFVSDIFPESPLEIGLWILLSIAAGVAEEIVFRGYCQRQLEALTRNVWIALLLQGILFGISHGYQGIGAMLRITVLGLGFGFVAIVRQKNSIEDLAWTIDELSFLPYYDKSDVTTLNYLKDYQNVLMQGTSDQIDRWENWPKISVSDSDAANQIALKLLNRGADGLFFDVSNVTEVNITQLLEKIDWSYCSISFLAADTKIATKILAYLEKKNYDLSELKGSIFWKKPLAGNALNTGHLQLLKKYHGFGIVVEPSSPVGEISEALVQAVSYIDVMTDAKVDKESAFRSISVSIYCEESFLITIAKLKALRFLWYQLARSFDIENYSPGDFHIHAYSEKWGANKFDPHGNMIKSTVHALAAVCGGCDSLTLCPEDENNELMNRVALNVSHILKEESHIDKVVNPLAGAYALESMIHELSKAAWSDFQNKMRS